MLSGAARIGPEKQYNCKFDLDYPRNKMNFFSKQEEWNFLPGSTIIAKKRERDFYFRAEFFVLIFLRTPDSPAKTDGELEGKKP